MSLDSNDFISFASDFNYQKLHPTTGTQTVEVVNPGTFEYEESITINHALGYVPQVKVWYEPTSGNLVPAVGRFEWGGASWRSDFTCEYTIDTNDVIITVIDGSPTARTTNIPVHYRIYYDEH